MKLTDTQLVILSAASQREDRAVDGPANRKGDAPRHVIAKLLSNSLLEEVQAAGTLPVWRKDTEKGALALRITDRGMQAIGVAAPAPEPIDTQAATGVPAAAARAAEPRRSARRRKAAPSPRKARSAPGPSKQDRVLEMLRGRQGATVPAIMKATAWQQHSVRGFFAGVVRKKLNLPLISEKTDHGRIYRIGSERPAKSHRKTKRRA
jgi:hypothetical protein